jgi:hypothetical protein
MSRARYRLHAIDPATNKILALAGRTETRDFLDTLRLDQTYLSVGGIIRAACGKDRGDAPEIILCQANRHARYQESDLEGRNLAHHVELEDLKRQWLDAIDRARTLRAQLPASELGYL